MDAIEALTTRRSASTFADAAPPRELVARIIEAATWAPNHHHTEPWRFAVLTSTAREKLGNLVAGWMRATLDHATAEKQAKSTQKKLLRAPVIIVVWQPGSPDAPTQDLEDYAACCSATQNLLLAAHAEGLVTKWSTGTLATAPPVFEYLGLARQDRIVAFVYLGFPTEGSAPRPAQRAPAQIDWRGSDD